MFPVQDLHVATAGWKTPPHYNRLVTTQSVYPSPTIPSRQPLHARPGPPAPSSHGGVGHFGGLHTHPHPPQPSSLPGLLVPQPTLFLSGSPIRPQCGTIHFYQGPGLASPYPPHPGDQYSSLPGRYCPLASLPHHSPPTRSSHNRETLGHGVSGQPPEVSAGTPNDPPVAGHPLALADGTLAGVPIHSRQDPVVYPPAPSARPHHPQALGGSGGSHKLRLPGAQPLEGLSPASDSRGVPRYSPGQRRLSPIPPTLRQALQFWVDPSIWDYVPPFQVTLPRLYLLTDASRSGWGALLHPQATAHALWGPLEAAFHINVLELRAVSQAIATFNLSSCHLVVYMDETVRFALTHLRTRSLPLREELKGLLHDTIRRQVFVHPLRIPTTLNVVADGLSRLEPLNTEWTLPPETFQAILRWAGPLQVDLLASPTNYRLPQWVSLFPHPDAVACNCLKFRLERLRQHLCVSASRTDSDFAATHPRLQRTSRAGGSLGPTRSLVAFSPPASSRRPPTPADYAIPTLRTRPGLPQVGDLRAMDRISFLRRALLTSRPAAVVDTLLASYRPSSQRQQEVAWTAFRHWLPLDRSTVTKDDVLAFLQDLFSTRSLAPSTILNYRAALQWPLEEAFSVDFSHPDFSRFATGLFHLRPPVPPDVPQWNLSAVIRFYEQVDHHTCSPRLLLFKTLCLTALASGNRCSELAHISRRAIVDQGSAITLPLLPHFLFKNQTASCCPPPISFPTFPNSSVCPVETLRVFLRRTTTWNHRDFLFVNPVSHASLVASHINYWLVQAILAADVGNAVVRAHDVRKFAFSINWARRADMSHIIKHGFWSSVHPFLNNYLTPLEGPFPGCIAAGSRI